MNTATVTRDQARRAIDRLERKISEFQNAAYERGASIADMESDPIGYEAARLADENARRACYDELEQIRALIVGLVSARDRAAERAWMPGAAQWTTSPIGGPSL